MEGFLKDADHELGFKELSEQRWVGAEGGKVSQRVVCPRLDMHGSAEVSVSYKDSFEK